MIEADMWMALAASVARAMHLLRLHGIPMTHYLSDPCDSGYIRTLRHYVVGRELVGSPVFHHDLPGSPDHHPRGAGGAPRLLAWVRGQDWGRCVACSRLSPGRRRGRGR